MVFHLIDVRERGGPYWDAWQERRRRSEIAWDPATSQVAVEGRVEVTGSRKPGIRIDGLACCDQFAAHHLSAKGFVRPAQRFAVGQWSSAELTQAGFACLRGAT